MLDKLSVPGRPTNLDNSWARAYCACSSCGWRLFGHFFSRLSFLFSFSLSRIWTEIQPQRAVKPKNPWINIKFKNLFCCLLMSSAPYKKE